MPVQQFTASPTHYSLYHSRSQQISPINSANATPSNASPTSPRGGPPHLPAHTRQLRPPKSPLYVPAVLRPTENHRRTRASPLTPPESNNSSFDDLENARTLSRRSTGSGKGGLGSIVEAEYSIDIEGLGKVTALPSRAHWKPDSDSQICDETTCPKNFSYFTRRHHCRRCGNIFCDAHSVYTIPLDQDANYHPKGFQSRSCEHCFIDYRRWAIDRSSRSNSEISEDDTQTPNAPVDCKARVGALGSVFGKGPVGGAPESVAQSVLRDWNWSTF